MWLSVNAYGALTLPWLPFSYLLLHVAAVMPRFALNIKATILITHLNVIANLHLDIVVHSFIYICEKLARDIFMKRICIYDGRADLTVSSMTVELYTRTTMLWFWQINFLCSDLFSSIDINVIQKWRVCKNVLSHNYIPHDFKAIIVTLHNFIGQHRLNQIDPHLYVRRQALTFRFLSAQH